MSKQIGRVRGNTHGNRKRRWARGARECLVGFPTVEVVHGTGAATPFSAAAVIYVNAGMTHPVETWLNSLAEGSRLLLPLTSDASFPPGDTSAVDRSKMMRSGFYLRIRRQRGTVEARCWFPVGLVPAEGMRDVAAEAARAGGVCRRWLAHGHPAGSWRRGCARAVLAAGH
jgi:protein-L-isoaspartate(D-aspartate) O-methyltransferase